MGDRNVDTEALEQVCQALSRYIEDIQISRAKMRDAAIDCADNMRKDAISLKNLGELEECVQNLDKTIKRAEELQADIRKKIQDIESILD